MATQRQAQSQRIGADVTRASARLWKRLKAAFAAVVENLVGEPVELEVSPLASFNTALKAAGTP